MLSLNWFELAQAGGVLLVTIGFGTFVHELSHAVVLRSIGVPYEIEWLPDRGGTGPVGVGIFGRWAAVTPRSLPAGLSPLGLRLAAVAPLALATPMALVLVGVLPDPTLTGNLPIIAATLAWFGCALPSPQDFSVFWHADRVIADRVGVGTDDELLGR